MTTSAAARPKVVIIGAGFGGLYAARALSKQPVDVLLIDRNNYHLFTPLLYQVATCGLDPSHIAYPVRGIFRKVQNVQFRLGEVVEVDTQAQTVSVRERAVDTETHQEPYDYLIVAAGSTNNFFGNANLQTHGFGMKDLSEAITLRNHILRLFEKAAWTDDPAERLALTTLVVVGGGPTGLETAGALYELYNHVLSAEYTQAPKMSARVVLIEAQSQLLAPYPEKLREAALRQLESLGVEVRLETKVQDVSETQVTLADGSIIPTHTLVWAAGVKATPIAELLGIEAAHGGRIPVSGTCQVEGLANVFAVGDIAYHLNAEDQKPYPQLIPVATQQGTLVAKNILSALNGQPMATFTYHDRGIMATIGRRRAVAWVFYRIQLTGWLAWMAWLALHLVGLMGFRNQVSVFINWVWNYLTYDRSVRALIREQDSR